MDLAIGSPIRTGAIIAYRGPSDDASINNAGVAQITYQVGAAQSLKLGDNQGDSGSVVIDGTNNGSLAVLPECHRNTSGNIYIGNRGSGTLSVANGGRIWNGHAYIAAVANLIPPASSGSVKLAGAGTVWTLAGDQCTGGAGLFIGCTATSDGGTALLNVEDGAIIEVENSIDAPDVKVGLSGTLMGNGLFILGGPTQLSQTTSVLGTLAPAGTLRIAGNLALEPKATTVCNVTPQTGDSVQVVQQYQGRTDGGWGHATLGGRLLVTMTGDFRSGPTRFTLLHAESGIDPNTKFASESIKYPTDQGFKPKITYDFVGNYVYLDLVFSQ